MSNQGDWIQGDCLEIMRSMDDGCVTAIIDIIQRRLAELD